MKPKQTPSENQPGRHLSRRALVGLSLAALALGVTASRSVRAQNDVNPPLPNVLLLVDSSGSMEYQSSATSFPTCDPTTNTGNQKSRWAELIEVMTGSISDYRCDAIDRNSPAFQNEYSLGGVNPYDFGYKNPYHRVQSGDCTPGPGTLGANVYDYPTGAINYHVYNNTGVSCSTFNQAGDGLMDSFLNQVRFGLMTFDTLPDSGTGHSGTALNASSGMAGTWSYFLGSARQGKPQGCSTLSDQEVGARNAAAPPWEGRMVAFGPPSMSQASLLQRNTQIQEILLASRPFGATPIAGLLDDARQFLWNDNSLDPINTTDDFGPYNDPYVNEGCRKNFIILLSDGEPNLDLRPYCENNSGPQPGVCPYDRPENIALDLATTGTIEKRVQTFVIGFAVSNITLSNASTVDCNTLTQSDLDDPTGLCAINPNEKQLQACCTLNRIAYNGGTKRAYFADDLNTLRSSLSAVLSTVAAATTSRTIPVSAAAPNSSDSFAGSYRFLTSFEPLPLQLWRGVVERQRYICKTDLGGNLFPEPQDIDRSKGDDFIANVNSGSGLARRFYSVLGNTVGGSVHSTRSIRPKAASNPDGVGSYSGTAYNGGASSFVASTPPEAMNVTVAACPDLGTDAACRDRFLQWDLGLDNGTVYHRCRTPGAANCNLVADVYHSTPRVVGRPSEFLRDESYTIFAAQKATRPTVLYTSTNDGFLHAFKVAANDPADTFKVNGLTNNELWAFIPPAVLPSIPSQYPGTHQILLDGIPVVKDVVARSDGSGGYDYERSPSDARDGLGTWRSVLVQGFGGGRGGYFALDVTDPDPNSGGGPKFLWQLTEDDNGAPLFGLNGGTPVITTLYFGSSGGANAKEVAVAILPGGEGGAPITTSPGCARQQSSFPNVSSANPPRSNVNCYPASGIGGRSLTIVRLDNGEIVRTFRQAASELPSALSSVITLSPLDSPITGTPVAFPGDTGSVADRVFVGDRDGTLWRVDVSSADPADWNMRIFFDAYWNDSFDAGQPIDTAPVLSVDEIGNVTVAFSTGDQDVLTATSGMKNYAVSLTEKLDGTGTYFQSNLNWYTQLLDGERVAGPMTLFNSALYFSSFIPLSAASSKVCQAGESRIWGVDYLLPKTPGTKSDGGKERLPQDPSNAASPLVQYIDNSSALLQDGAVIFGVGVAQLPTCTQEGSVTDPYFGTGTHTSISTTAPGKFQLVMQTGNVGTAIPGGKTNTIAIELPNPPVSSHIDSWAAIIE